MCARRAGKRIFSPLTRGAVGTDEVCKLDVDGDVQLTAVFEKHVETTAVSDTEAEPGTDPEAVTTGADASDTTEEPKSGGCRSGLGALSAAGVLVGAAAAVALKKKED